VPFLWSSTQPFSPDVKPSHPLRVESCTLALLLSLDSLTRQPILGCRNKRQLFDFRSSVFETRVAYPNLYDYEVVLPDFMCDAGFHLQNSKQCIL
jgi:hypothetical protein